MKTIVLTQSKVTTVDDDVYEWASKFKWYAFKSRRTFYAARADYQEGKRARTVFLHIEILKPEGGLKTDHKDGDGLNNARDNLRVATHTQNQQARHALKADKTSKFKGVCLRKDINKWQASIRNLGKLISLGCYGCEEDAARRYDAAAIKYFGEYAVLNFP